MAGVERVSKRTLALAALAVSTLGLAVNDHVLKGNPAVANWLTGKLSDFTGLIVAPLTLMLIFGARSRRSRLLCTLVPSLAFALINLSAACSTALVGAAAMIGLSWQLWPDTADVWCLSVLPITWILGGWLATPASRYFTSAEAPSLFSRTLALAGALACIASSTDVPRHSAPAYLVNRTGQMLVVEAAYLLGEIDCSAHATIPSDFLRHDDFAPGKRYSLEPNGVLPLGGATDYAERACGPVRIVLPNLTLGVDWDGALAPRELPNVLEQSDLDDNRQLIVIPKDDSWPPPSFGAGTRRLGITRDADAVADSGCAQAALPRLEFSAENGSFSQLSIVAKEALDDACFRLTLASAAATNSRDLLLCMPDSEFPFLPGDVVNASITDGFLTLSDSAEHVPSITLYRGVWDAARLPLRFAPAECGYLRDGCGAIWQALDAYAVAPGNQVDTLLLPGQPVFVPGWGFSYDLVRALRPIVARPECDPASKSFTPWIELIQRTE